MDIRAICQNSSVTNIMREDNRNMVAYFCHQLSDSYADLSDNYVDLSDLYVDLSDNYVDLLENYN